MINEAQTKEIFKYRTADLKPSSCKSVIWYCKQCGIEKEKKFREAKLIKLCLNCSNKINSNTNIEQRNRKIKENWKIKGHPRLGKKHTEESKKKISLGHLGIPSNLSLESREKFRQVCITRNKSPEMRRKVSTALKGRKLSAAHKRKSRENRVYKSGIENANYGKSSTMSVESRRSQKEKLSKRFSGKGNPMYGKAMTIVGRHPFTDKNGRYFTFRSSWELKLAQYFENSAISWNYEPKAFEIIIVKNNVRVVRTYTPDFYLPDTLTYIEVKGYWRGEGELKYNAFIMQYPQEKINLYNESKLRSLGIQIK